MDTVQLSEGRLDKIMQAGAVPRRRALARLCLPLMLCLLLSACFGGGAATGAPQPTSTISAPRSIPRAAITYVAIGASDAFGIGTKVPNRDNWPAVLASKLGVSVHLVNVGIPGATVAIAMRDEAPIAVASQPDIITVFLGVNDLDTGITLDTFRTQITELLRTLASLTSAHIFVGNLPDLTLLPYFANRDPVALRHQVLDWNIAIAEAADASHAFLVDVYDSWGDLALHPEYISGDGFHPSTLGAARLADTFERAVLASAKSPS